MTEAIACTTEQTILGEGAQWDARRGELLRVDILAGRVYRDLVGDDGALVPVARYQVPGIGVSEHAHPNALLVDAGEAVLSSSRPSFRRNPVGIV